MLKPSLEDFKHNLTRVGDECRCPVVWTLFSTALLGNWDEDWPFPVIAEYLKTKDKDKILKETGGKKYTLYTEERR